MLIEKITSHEELIEQVSGTSKAFVLLYKESSDISGCALSNIEKAVDDLEGEALVLRSDVSKTRDIHALYNVNSVPSLLVFKDGEFSNVVKGCMDADYYSSLINETIISRGVSGDDKPKKNVIVYSTPTCSWCTKIKSHLKDNNIRYREIDVAANPAMAEEMKRKSGQMGVPQTEINGQMIVGFDRAKIDRLLEIA